MLGTYDCNNDAIGPGHRGTLVMTASIIVRVEATDVSAMLIDKIRINQRQDSCRSHLTEAEQEDYKLQDLVSATADTTSSVRQNPI